MKLSLAGYNVDSEILKELKEKSGWNKDNLTPETLSAAYARISRDPRDIDQLRADARESVDMARKSNETIIFGLGHSSVAEHAIFNFDVLDVSRLAVEAVQHFRMASFTEKSQRYIKIGEDYIVPEEIKGTKYEPMFVDMVKKQIEAYNLIYSKLKEFHFSENPEIANSKKGKLELENLAKEDARYVLPLATTSQFGMTINARSLESMIKRFMVSDIKEVSELGKGLYDLVKEMAPSVIKYVKPSDYETKTSKLLAEIAEKHKIELKKLKEETSPSLPVRLIHHSKNPDNILCASILFDNTEHNWETCVKAVENMYFGEEKELVVASLKYRNFYDSVLRAFEQVNYAFELIVSATCYAQIKRHRMSTQLIQEYDPSLGVTLPPSIEKIGMERIFFDITEQSAELFHEIKKDFPKAASYVLTNAHRRRIMFRINARGLYNFVNLRQDQHAQWDIRHISELIKAEAEKVSPLVSMMLCGKSCFEEKIKNL